MLNALFRGVARLAHASLLRLAAPCLCACLVWSPAAHAAEPPAADHAAIDPFKRYQGWRNEPVQDWRAVNERVGEVGGWRTYLRESQPVGDGAGQNAPGHHGHHGH